MTHSTVFLVQHEYEDEDGNSDTKLIGIYSTDSNATSAVERLKPLPGFRDYPGAFTIARYEIDKDHWVAGFVRA